MLTTSNRRRRAELDTRATVTRTPTTRKSLLDELASDPDSDSLDEFARIVCLVNIEISIGVSHAA